MKNQYIYENLEWKKFEKKTETNCTNLVNDLDCMMNKKTMKDAKIIKTLNKQFFNVSVFFKEKPIDV